MLLIQTELIDTHWIIMNKIISFMAVMLVYILPVLTTPTYAASHAKANVATDTEDTDTDTDKKKATDPDKKKPAPTTEDDAEPDCD